MRELCTDLRFPTSDFWLSASGLFDEGFAASYPPSDSACVLALFGLIPGSNPRSKIIPMPTYVYETIPRKPGQKPRSFEVKQSMHDAALTKHPETGEPV